VVRAREAGAAYHEPNMSPREARADGGNRGESVRNGDRAMARPDKDKDEVRNHEAREGEAGNRGQRSPHDNPKPTKQEKQAQKQAQKQAKADQKRNSREER